MSNRSRPAFVRKKVSEKAESVYSANEIRPQSAFAPWKTPSDMQKKNN